MKTRVVSACVLIILLVPILIIGGIPFAILMSVLACLGLRELLNISNNKNIPEVLKTISYILVGGFTLLSYFFSKKTMFYIDYRIISVLIIIFFVPLILKKTINKYKISDCIFLFGTTFFMIFCFTTFIFIRNYNLNCIIYLLLITITTDTFAYITGRKMGKHKLAPLVSPNKTIEGSIGGSIMGTILPSIFFITVIGNINAFSVIVMSLGLSIIAQIGDLVFSAIKRNYNVKDFSNLIPGHGGVLDRLDSLIFVSITFVLFINIL